MWLNEKQNHSLWTVIVAEVGAGLDEQSTRQLNKHWSPKSLVILIESKVVKWWLSVDQTM